MKKLDQPSASSRGIDFSQFSGIARPIDLNYRTNLIISFMTLLVMIVSTIFRLSSGSAWLESVISGVVSGLSAFLAWALTRELDPDHNVSAFVSAGLALFGTLWRQPEILVLVWFILVMRIVNRTTGTSVTILDSLGLVAISAWLIWGQGNWGYGFGAAAAFILDALLEPENRKQLLFAGVVFFGTTIWTFLTAKWWHGSIPMVIPTAFVALMSIFFIPLIIATRNLKALGDYDHKPLESRRVQAAQIVALVLGLQLALWTGLEGITAILPFWAAVLGAGVYKFIEFGISRFSK